MIEYFVYKFNKLFRPEALALHRAEVFISNGLNSAIKDGCIIIDDIWGGKINDVVHCCAVGAMALDDKLTDFSNGPDYVGYEKTYSSIFHNKPENFWAFVKGFSNMKYSKGPTKWFELGFKLRKKYKPKKFIELKRLSEEKLSQKLEC